MDDLIFKKIPLTKLDFKDFEIPRNFLYNPRNFCLILFFNVYKEKMFTI